MKSEKPFNDDVRALHELLRNARRAKGISQAELAAQSGCTQSAISMMEQGRQDALSKDKLARLTQILQVSFNIDLQASEQAQHGFCPNQYCPSAALYAAGNDLFLWPQLFLVSEQHGRYCRYCGEVMETCCRQCGRAAVEGACCRHCGNPYISIDANAHAGLREKLTNAAETRAAAAEFRYQHDSANVRRPAGLPVTHA